MPRPTKYRRPKRLSQVWPLWLHQAVETAAQERGEDSTAWLQRVAQDALTRQWSRGRLQTLRELERSPQPA